MAEDELTALRDAFESMASSMPDPQVEQAPALRYRPRGPRHRLAGGALALLALAGALSGGLVLAGAAGGGGGGLLLDGPTLQLAGYRMRLPTGFHLTTKGCSVIPGDTLIGSDQQGNVPLAAAVSKDGGCLVADSLTSPPSTGGMEKISLGFNTGFLSSVTGSEGTVTTLYVDLWAGATPPPSAKVDAIQANNLPANELVAIVTAAFNPMYNGCHVMTGDPIAAGPPASTIPPQVLAPQVAADGGCLFDIIEVPEAFNTEFMEPVTVGPYRGYVLTAHEPPLFRGSIRAELLLLTPESNDQHEAVFITANDITGQQLISIVSAALSAGMLVLPSCSGQCVAAGTGSASGTSATPSTSQPPGSSEGPPSSPTGSTASSAISHTGSTPSAA